MTVENRILFLRICPNFWATNFSLLDAKRKRMKAFFRGGGLGRRREITPFPAAKNETLGNSIDPESDKFIIPPSLLIQQ